MESSYTVPWDGMEAKEHYKSENQYFYNVLQNYAKGGQGLIYISKHELTLDGRKTFCEMMDFYDRKENLTPIQTVCNTKLSKMKLNQNYKGSTLKEFEDRTSRTYESNKLQKTGGGGKGGGDKGKGKDKPWKNDHSAWVPKNKFYKLQKEEKEKQIKIRAETKRGRTL
eukprot:3355439-Ditylum_brightwellii.AAC.1